MNTHTKPQDRTGSIDLGRETDFALGALRVHPSTCEVEAAARRETMQPRAMQVLVALARAKGTVVSRDQLIQLCWDGRIIGEDAINRAVAKVRAVAALIDPPAFELETIPRVGFRLKVTEPEKDASPSPSTMTAIPPAQAPIFSLIRWRPLVLGIAVAAILAMVLFAVFWRGQTHAPQTAKPIEASIAVLPFLNMSGDPAKEYFSDGFSEELLND